jgi:spore protease
MNYIRGDKMNDVNIRTDLIIDNLEQGQLDDQNAGFKVDEYNRDEFKVTEVTVPKEQAEAINKKSGTYITIDTSSIIENDHESLLRLQKLIASYIDKFLEKYDIKKEDMGMVVGLGNNDVTPDALGPLVVSKVFVTNHLFELHPETISIDEFRPICALSPSVMGSTGIETYVTINSVVQNIKPKFLIVVDALASKSIKRVNKTIQLSDAGISPGSGVGNKRKEISMDTVNIPVITIGVPTVVDAVTITSDTIDMLMRHLSHHLQNQRASNRIVPASSQKIKDIDQVPLVNENVLTDIFGQVGLMSMDDKKRLIHEVLTPQGLNMMVTPKEIDTNIEDLAHVISRGINLAMHKNIS